MMPDSATPRWTSRTDAPAFGDSIDVFGADAAAAGVAPAATPKADAAAAAEPVGPTDPAVLAILDWKPQTPAQLLRAIDILAELQHAAHAKPFVDQLSQSNLDAAAKAELVDSINPARLLKLASNPELATTLGPMIDDWMQAAEEYRRDEQRLAATAKLLTDPSPRVREQAVVDLLRARESAVAPLVAILADPNRAAEHAAAKQVLLFLGGQAIEPLLGVLETPNTELKTQAMEILGQLSAIQAVPQLLGPLLSQESSTPMRSAASQALAKILGHTPDYDEALRRLEKAARTPLEASRNDDPLTAAPAVVWHWNRHTNESMPVVYDQTGAALAKATRLARDLYMLDTQRGDWRRLYLTAMLQAAQVRRGLGQPLSAGRKHGILGRRILRSRRLGRSVGARPARRIHSGGDCRDAVARRHRQREAAGAWRRGTQPVGGSGQPCRPAVALFRHFRHHEIVAEGTVYRFELGGQRTGLLCQFLRRAARAGRAPQ